MSEAEERADRSKHRYRVVDVFKLEGGRITRDAETESWRGTVNPVLVDLDSGIIQLGACGTPVQWDIVQSAGPGWDFIAVRREFGNTVLSTLRVRPWESPAQMVLTLNGFTFVTGIGEPPPPGGGEPKAPWTEREPGSSSFAS
jgi:hypothetical protein